MRYTVLTYWPYSFMCLSVVRVMRLSCKSCMTNSCVIRSCKSNMTGSCNSYVTRSCKSIMTGSCKSYVTRPCKSYMIRPCNQSSLLGLLKHKKCVIYDCQVSLESEHAEVTITDVLSNIQQTKFFKSRCWNTQQGISVHVKISKEVFQLIYWCLTFIAWKLSSHCNASQDTS